MQCLPNALVDGSEMNHLHNTYQILKNPGRPMEICSFYFRNNLTEDMLQDNSGFVDTSSNMVFKS